MTALGEVRPEPAASLSGTSGAEPPRSRKSATAFRTISEVAEDLHIPQHVLRFWETKFPQLKPLKRGGGRRYYRPEDVALLRRIGDLLYTQGYTIKGVQRLLRGGSAEGAETEALEEGQRDLLGEAPLEGPTIRACLDELEAIARRLAALTGSE
ncbi:MerR family transcriptional regulator [Roseomonas sp. CCTCC AB2023176]|uniref:MerR family transcriptional regulator n=1 Tax=Roseomonas sp. CCTCC AB2023176 TaxID=3342640 RepID=UPI0035DF670D